VFGKVTEGILAGSGEIIHDGRVPPNPRAYYMMFFAGYMQKMIGSHQNPRNGINSGLDNGNIMDLAIVSERRQFYPWIV